MEANVDIKEKVKSNEQLITQAGVKLAKAKQAYDSEISEPEKENREILNNFRDKINEKIRSESKCRCDLKWLYDEAEFFGGGITMRIDADHPNDIRDDDWTWEEVEEILSK
jgi:hypothetical protein